MSKQAITASVVNRARRFTFGPKRPSTVMKTAQMQGNVLELVGNNPEQRNWKGILIAVLVILMVCGCVVLAVLLLSEDDELVMLANVRLSDIVDAKWKEGLASDAKWVSGSLVWKDADGNVQRMISPNIEATMLIPNTTMENLGIVDFAVSGDFLYALLAYNKKAVNSYSYKASYILYDIQARTRRPFLHKNSIDVLQYANFGPSGNQLIYIVEGDIYYQKSAKSPAKNLTNDNQESLIINGLANWQYEEQVFKGSVAHWFSPNGQYLAYARFDDRNVAEAFVTAYSSDTSSGQTPYVYPQIESYRYSKPGYPNTIVNVHVVDLLSEKAVALTRPLLYRKRLDVLHAVSWSRDNQTMLITWSNRTQSVSVTQQCSPDLSTCVDDILHLKPVASPNPGWIPHMNQPYLFSNEPGIFFYILLRSQGGRSSFRHLAMVNYTEKPPVVTYLTDGSWEVTKVLHYSPSSRSVYYISNEQDHNTRHVYQVFLDNLDRSCLTCCQPSDFSSNIFWQDHNTLKKIETNCCLFYDAEFGTSSNWFLLHCLGPGIPYSATGSVMTKQNTNLTTLKTSSDSLQKGTLKILSVHLDKSEPMPPNFVDTVIGMYRYGTVKVADRTIKVRLLLPKEDHMNHVPVVIQVGDLGAQEADFRFRLEFGEYFMSTYKVVFVFLDGAGSGFRGNDIMQSISGQPGILEIEDIEAVVKHLKLQWSIVPSRVGIIGKGYGGYVSVHALSDPRANIQCGVAISPIIDWSLYSSFESEKILGLPSVNPLNYQKSNLLKKVDYLKGRNLLVLQGMKDKVVNQQHAILLQQGATNNNLPLETLKTIYYADQNHRLTNKKAKETMYKAAGIFLLNCLLGGLDSSDESA